MSKDKAINKLASDIDATRARLVANVDELLERSQPEKIAQNQLDRVKNYYLDGHGGVRVDRAGKTAGIFFGLVLLRKLFK